ncbi:ABC transporter permease [Mesorhizobium sp. RP14(2022)]|uniref:ABC transporter permease n=1 Tax=Mesorhizobium liriopis TaxID=2953882 RepID=A0ABT1C0Z3_9HYPH|nr:ABC transporter permease [Mesorhizobium liriopis]MCO6048484.1 ABC transporter permease [Mesorhizobium liriopis]
MSDAVLDIPSRNRTRRSRSFWRKPWLLSAVLLVVFIGINILIQPRFFSAYALGNIITTMLPWMLIAVGQTYVIFGGSIDLSLGAIVSLVNVVVVVLITALGGGPGAMVLGMVAGLLLGTLCGALNGFLISAFRLQAIVTTFATSIIYGGAALVVLPQAGGSLPTEYFTVYSEGFFGLTLPIYLLVALILVAAFVATTRYQKHLLATGGNRQAAFQTGLPVRRIVMGAHAIAGFMSAVAALCILGVAGAGDPLMGQAFTLGSVSAVVLGGTALAGGWGSVTGSIIGAAILALINNIIFFSGIDYIYQAIVQGGIILAALAAGVFASRRQK